MNMCITLLDVATSINREFFNVTSRTCLKLITTATSLHGEWKHTKFGEIYIMPSWNTVSNHIFASYSIYI